MNTGFGPMAEYKIDAKTSKEAIELIKMTVLDFSAVMILRACDPVECTNKKKDIMVNFRFNSVLRAGLKGEKVNFSAVSFELWTKYMQDKGWIDSDLDRIYTNED